MEIVLIQMFYLSLAINKKNENTEYHGTFIPFNSQLYWKPASTFFFLFESWNLVYHFVKSLLANLILPPALYR